MVEILDFVFNSLLKILAIYTENIWQTLRNKKNKKINVFVKSGKSVEILQQVFFL